VADVGQRAIGRSKHWRRSLASGQKSQDGPSGSKTSSAEGTDGGIRTGHAGVAEWTALLTIYTSTDVFLSYPSRIAEQTAEAAWMVPLLSAIIAASVFWLVQLCMLRFSQTGLITVLWERVSPIAGMTVALAGAAFFLVQTALVMREFTETVVTTVLPSTPAAVVTILFLLVVMNYAYKGIEGMTRVAILLSVVMLGGLALLLILPLTWFDASLLSPIMGKGVGSIVLSALTNTSMFIPPFVLSILQPSVRNQKHVLQIGLVSSLLTGAIISLVLVVFIGTFAVAVTGKIPFPMYQLSRLIYVGRFVQRLESLFVFLWTAAAVIKMGLGLWLTAYLYARAFKMPFYRPLVVPFGLLMFIVSFLPPDFTTVMNLSGEVLERYGWVVTMALPLLAASIAVVVDWLRSGGRRNEPDSDPPAGENREGARA